MVTKVRKKKRLPKRVYILRRILVFILFVIFIIGIFFAFIFFRQKYNERNSYRSIYNVELSKKELSKFELDLDIQKSNFLWTEKLNYVNKPNRIIVHHSAKTGLTPQDINAMHKARGWAGIGYHFYIRKDGTIYEGRPTNAIGAHASNNNINTLGICLEGNFEEEKIEDIQLESIIKLSTYLSLRYPIESMVRHGDVKNTLCPGKNIDVKDLEKRMINNIKTLG